MIFRVVLLLNFISFYSLEAANLEAIQQLQKTFRGKKGFEVRFEQEVAQLTFKDQQNKATGSVRFERPAQLKWSYETPSARTIQYENKKLTISENGQPPQEVKAMGPLNLQESFSFLWGETNQTLYKIENLNAESFRIRPRSVGSTKNIPFRSIDVTVKQGKVVEAKIENNLEGTSHLYFHDWRLF